MEEDTGKTTHGSPSGRIHDADAALVDFNRAGAPVRVSEPDIRSPEEAGAYLRELRATLESLDVSDVRMEEVPAALRREHLDAPVGTEVLGTKVEIKNMNSVRSLERALVYEISRQTKALEAGETIVQETRHRNEDAGATASSARRRKRSTTGISPSPTSRRSSPRPRIEELRLALPELPEGSARALAIEHGLPEVARVLGGPRIDGDVRGDRRARCGPSRGRELDHAGPRRPREQAGRRTPPPRVTPQYLADLLEMLGDDSISGTGAKQALEEAAETGDAIETIVERTGLRQVSDSGELGSIVDGVLTENADAAQKFRDGNRA